MRGLTAKQKKIIDKSVKEGIEFSEDMPEEDINEIVRLNDYETLFWDIDRYLCDEGLAMSRMVAKVRR